jgi:transposase
LTTPKQEAIKVALLENPGLSNRQIAKRIGGAHHVTVGTVRAKMENAGELQRTDVVRGGDGKSYSKAKTAKPKPKATKPDPTLDDQVKMAMTSLLRTAKRDERLEELADAFRKFYGAHLVPPRVTPTAPLAEVGTEVADPAKPHAVARDPEEPFGASPPVSEASPPKLGVPPVRNLRDVTRDITPDADNDDYGDLPTEERIALHEDQAALERTPQPEPEGWWELAKVVHLHQATHCGRVRFRDGGELDFTDKTPREDGLVLKVGLDVDCRIVELSKDGRRYTPIVELASPEELPNGATEIPVPQDLPYPPPVPGQHPEHCWMMADVVSYDAALQTGIVQFIKDGVKLRFGRYTPRDPGLVLRVGAQVEVRRVAVGSRPDLRVTGLARRLPA